MSTHAVWAWRKAFGTGQRGTVGSRRLYDATVQKIGDVLRGKRLPAKAVRERRKRAIDLDLGKHLRKYQEQQRAERSWTYEEAALLGTMPDTKLAKQLQRTRYVVRRERICRGITKYRKPMPPEASLSPRQRELLRREPIAASKRGKKRPRKVMLAAWAANRGRKVSKATKAKMAAAARRRVAAGFIPNGRLWTAAEDRLIQTLPAAEAARRTGRTLTSVYSRRIKLGVEDERATNGRTANGTTHE